jgi:hypothetical protein
MSDAPFPAPALPLFFTRMVAVTPEQHGRLRLDRASAGFGFAAHAQTVPLGLGELEAAAQSYPILFTQGPNCIPVALLGLRDQQNLFVSDGRWRADSYLPAYVRAFPFILVEDQARHTTFVAMQAEAESVRAEGGLPLFEDGKPAPALAEAIAACSAFRDNAHAAAAFGRALDAAGLLAEEEATVTFTAGGRAQVRGFKLAKPERLDRIPDEIFLDWRRRGWLGPLYAHFHSAGRWGRLIELAAAAG